MTAPFVNPALEDIRQLLTRVRRIAIVGLSPRPSRPSHGVAAALQGWGYQIVPVRPAVDQILGEPAFASLYALPQKVDLVNVFRAPRHVDEIVQACIALQLPSVWLQDGVVNVSAACRARQAGLTVIMDRCIYRDYVRLLLNAQ